MRLFTRYLFPIIFFLLILFSISQISYAISGCHCTDSKRCYSDGCTRKTWQSDHLEWEAGCNENFCGGGHYNECYDTGSADSSKYFCLEQPPCCRDMVTIAAQGISEPAKACCFPEIGYCHPFFCAKVGNPSGCGHYWKWHGNVPDWMAKGYGCMIGTSEENMKPLYGLPAGVPGGGQTTLEPTTVPPTSEPTQYIPPTEEPTTAPTSFTPPPTTYVPHVSPVTFDIPSDRDVVPTNIPAINPTIPTPNNLSFSLPSLTLPSINIEPLKKGLKNTIVQSEKVLNIPAEAANKITQLDSSLETMINNFIKNLFGKFSISKS